MNALFYYLYRVTEFNEIYYSKPSFKVSVCNSLIRFFYSKRLLEYKELVLLRSTVKFQSEELSFVNRKLARSLHMAARADLAKGIAA